jgi:hypothetical protein
MGQLGFFDADKRLAAISAKGDPLEMIDRVVPFESFRAEIEAVVLTPAEDKKSSAGPKPIEIEFAVIEVAFDDIPIETSRCHDRRGDASARQGDAHK